MKNMLAALSVALLLSACSDKEAAATNEASVNEAVEEAAPPPPLDIAGSYRVESYRGKAIPADVPIMIRIDDKQIRMTTPCANAVWDYEMKGSLITPKAISGTKTGCAASGGTFEGALSDGFSLATIVMEQQGGLKFSGAGGYFLLAPR